MKSAPNSKANLDRAIFRFAGNNLRETALRSDMANAIVAQLLGDGVVKGGSGLKFRYGENMSRITRDLDTARRTDLDAFLHDLRARLAAGWEGFTGEVLVQKQGSPLHVPFEYVMQPCDVKLNYLGKPWFTVKLEIGHNEIGDADACDLVEIPQELIDLHRLREICHQLFYYRRQQPWPPTLAKLELWEQVYNERKGNLNVLSSVDEAIDWANDLVARIEQA